MKKISILIVLLFCVTVVFAQNYSLDSNGKIQQTENSRGRVKADTIVYAVYNGITFYQNVSTKSVYYWRQSKKSGKWYKVYVKPKKVTTK